MTLNVAPDCQAQIFLAAIKPYLNGKFSTTFYQRERASKLCGLYYKHIFTIVSDACTINVFTSLCLSLSYFALALASVINNDRK